MDWGSARAIETRYAGCRFRSRLEARWAVFFDVAGIPWHYEPQGFELAGLRYLPDFWLPRTGYWVEVKPRTPDATEMEKAVRLADESGRPVLVLHGTIDPIEQAAAGSPILIGGRGNLLVARPGGQVARWCECPDCGWLAVVGWWGETAPGIPACHDHSGEFDPMSPRLLAAYAAAKSARFERGA